MPVRMQVRSLLAAFAAAPGGIRGRFLTLLAWLACPYCLI
jgi:hypothetical protein